MNTLQDIAAPEIQENPSSADVPGRRRGLGVAEFIAEYRDPRRPVILTDATSGWPIYGRGTPDYFRARYGEHKLGVWGADMRLADLLDLLAASSVEQPGPYPCKYEIAKAFRELLPEVSPRFAYSLPDRQGNPLVPQRLFSYVNNLEIFFGGPGGQFPYLHYDVFHLHAWITQLYGDKEFTLYAPEQAHLLYINPETPWQSNIKNHHKPDYDRYPLLREAKPQKVVIQIRPRLRSPPPPMLREAKPQKVVIHAGETRFLPCGWWHTARSLNLTISVAFDQLGPDNWEDFVGDVADEARRNGRTTKAAWLGGYLHTIAPLLRVGERFGAGRSRNWGQR
jgi:hypothetical protein